MKKRLTAIILMLTVFTTGALAATTYKKSIEVEYGITLAINGDVPALTDAKGKSVQPFVYNGTTYVPIRAVAENMGASVGYYSDIDTAQIWQDDTEAMYVAYKMYKCDEQIADCITLLYDSATIQLPASERLTNISALRDAIESAYSAAYDEYDVLYENNNLYVNTMTDCMNSLNDAYSLFDKAATAAERYVSTGNHSYIDTLLDFVEEHVLSHGCSTQVDKFFESMWQ